MQAGFSPGAGVRGITVLGGRLSAPAVRRYWTPDEFRSLRDEGMTMGFRHVESGPLVRSSYHAERHVSPGAEATA